MLTPGSVNTDKAGSLLGIACSRPIGVLPQRLSGVKKYREVRKIAAILW
jgi:hypothetical protein